MAQFSVLLQLPTPVGAQCFSTTLRTNRGEPRKKVRISIAGKACTFFPEMRIVCPAFSSEPVHCVDLGNLNGQTESLLARLKRDRNWHAFSLCESERLRQAVAFYHERVSGNGNGRH